MKRTLIKIITATLVSIAVVGIAIYEVWSIATKEHVRQLEIAESAEAEIGLKLNMVKVAVQTEDSDLYKRSLDEVKSAVNKIHELPMVLSEYANYLERLSEYVEMLDKHSDVVGEIHELKTEFEKMTDELKEKYSGEISRESLRAAKDEIAKLKVDASKFLNEKVSAVVNAVNETLDKTANKVGELSDCIDNCYKDKIAGLDDELADIFKELSGKAPELNKDLEAQFELEKINEIRR